ncbi:hypothetical protein Hanom_Chr09g00821211 [Helianthus anomalus]|nr:hypothetical protein HanPSC8_Chr08g0318111 [Helianthus annuus]
MLVTYFHLFRFQQVLGLETEIRMLKSLDLESLKTLEFNSLTLGLYNQFEFDGF